MPIVVSTSTGTARPVNFASLKARVARVIGGQGQSSMLSLAGDLINENIIDMNMRLYDFNKVNAGVITCTSGIGTLPTPFYKEIEAYLCSSTGTKILELQYRDWAEYQQTFNAQPLLSGSIIYYTIFNQHSTSQITLLPTPSSGTDYINLTYYKRIALLDDDGEVLDCTQEVERVIVLKAQADLLRVIAPENPMFAATSALADRALNNLTYIDRKHPDMKPRFRLAPIAARQPTSWGDVIYVRTS